MATCDKCGNKIGILAKKHYYEDEDGKKLIYCSECDEEHEEYFSYPGKKKGSYEITPEQVTNEEPETPDIDNKKREKAIMEVTILIVAKKKFEQALKKFEPIFDKRLESDWYTKGNIYANLGKTKDAIKCYDEALYLDTHYAKAWYRKGWVLIETKEFKNAIKCFENVIKLQDIGEPYSNSNWALASKFSKMLALIYYNNSLIFKK
nr:tetratricopeptide repeat protein [archaeon]